MMQASSTTYVTDVTYMMQASSTTAQPSSGINPRTDQEGWCCDAESAGHPPFRCTRCKPAWPEVLTDAATVEVAAAPPAALDFAGRRQVLLVW